MFRPVPMKRLSVVVLARDERAVLRGLGELGAVQLLRTPAGPDTAPLPAPDRGRELARCARILARAAEIRRTLALPPAEAAASPTDMTPDAAEEMLGRMEARTAELVRMRQLLLQEWSRAASLREESGRPPSLDLPLDAMARSPFLHFVTGTLPAENLDKARSDLGDRGLLLPLHTPPEQRPLLVAVAMQRHRAALDRALLKAGFRPEDVRGARLPPAAAPTEGRAAGGDGSERDRTAAECARVEGELHAHAVESAEPLARIERWAAVERSLLEAEQYCPRTEGAVLLMGWSAAEDVAVIERRLNEITGGRCACEASDPEDEPEEQIPILLRPPPWLRPFEALVSSYGLPLYRDLEPTLFVAVSYVAMFGMMFGDAGHGALVALAGLVLRFASRSPRGRDAGLLVCCAGCSSILFGAIYGSYFGLEAGRRLALWRDPLRGDPMGSMKLAMGFGVGMISLGLLLNVVNRLRHRDFLGGLLGRSGLFGLLFYWGALVLVTHGEALRARDLTGWVIGGCLVLPALGWLLKEPLHRVLHPRRTEGPPGGGGFVAGAMESVMEAFEAVLAFLANTVSFVRLAAYAMSHSALLVATFALAVEVERVSGGNRALAVVVIVLGNAVALLLEGVVAAIQALRLEYYEFFGKFLPGSGRPFRPFRLADRARA